LKNKLYLILLSIFLFNVLFFTNTSILYNVPEYNLEPNAISISKSWYYTTDSYGIQSSPRAVDIDCDGI